MCNIHIHSYIIPDFYYITLAQYVHQKHDIIKYSEQIEGKKKFTNIIKLLTYSLETDLGGIALVPNF